MRLRFLGIALGFLLVPAVASADAHRWGLFAAGSYLKASSLLGNHTSAEIVLADITKPGWRKYVTIIGDFSVHGGTHEGDEVAPRTGLAGGGLRFARSDKSKVVGGVHLLYGGVSGPGGNQTWAVGGLFEYVPLRNEIGWHPGFRFQYDFLNREGDEDFHRFSAGVVLRYKPH